MLLTLTTTHRPATDLGYLLHKNPSKLQTFELSFGRAHVFYPEANDERCTVALLLEVDPIDLARGRAHTGSALPLEPYVNDRPYAASSFLSVAIAQVLGSALGGRSKDRPAVAGQEIPLVATLSVVPSRGGERLLRDLFTPLGYTVTATNHVLDETHPEWTSSPYFTVRLEGTRRLGDFLSHLYVLIPVLDDDKHYWVGDDEVAKLLRHGEGWLSAHPARDLIARRYLRHQGGLTRAALKQLLAEGAPTEETAERTRGAEEAALEKPLRLDQQRIETVTALLTGLDVARVVDLGCGEGKLLRALLKHRGFTDILGMDVSHRALAIAHERLNLDELPQKQRARIRLIQGSLIYRDARIAGFDVATLVEVIEHLDPPRLAALERVVFEMAHPGVVVVTTPNAEYNVKFETLPAGRFRHSDHRFEWTRSEFEAWSHRVADRFRYAVRFEPIGALDPALGAPTQMAVFTS